MSTELDVVSYLTSKGLQPRRANGPEVMVPCPECGEPADSRKRKLYVNTESAWFHCKVCDAHGGSTLLQRMFGDDPKVDSEGKPRCVIVSDAGAALADIHTRRKILKEATDWTEEALAANDDVLLYLMNDRGLSPETIVERRLGLVPLGWSLADALKSHSKADLRTTGLVYRDGPKVDQDFLWDHITIPYLSRGSVAQLRGRIRNPEGSGAKYMTGPGEDVLLYGADDIADAAEVIITEGEFDAMVVKQHLQSAPDKRTRAIGVVALAGANGFKEGFERYLEGVKRIYIALDPDDTGKREAVKIKERLGARARIVELPPELPKCDWTEYLLPVPEGADTKWHLKHAHAGHTWRDIMGLIGTASGKRVFSVRESGIDFRNLANAGAGIKTGYEPLDRIIQPGVLPGQVVVLLAKTGTGKTVTLCNLGYNMRKRRILFISLEMTKAEVYMRLRRIYLFHHPLATDDEIDEAYSNILICEENRLTDEDFKLLVEEYTEEIGERPEAVFVDYLGYYSRGQKGATVYERATNGIMQLKAEAKAHRVSVWTPSQVNRNSEEGKPLDLDDARDSGAVEETADFLFGLWRPDDALQVDSQMRGSGKLKLTLLKSRHGGKDRVITLMMDYLSLAIVDDASSLSRRADNHNFMHWRGYTWDQMRTEETRPVQGSLPGMATQRETLLELARSGKSLSEPAVTPAGTGTGQTTNSMFPAGNAPVAAEEPVVSQQRHLAAVS